jgi:hypothetical protein
VAARLRVRSPVPLTSRHDANPRGHTVTRPNSPPLPKGVIHPPGGGGGVAPTRRTRAHPIASHSRATHPARVSNQGKGPPSVRRREAVYPPGPWFLLGDRNPLRARRPRKFIVYPTLIFSFCLGRATGPGSRGRARQPPCLRICCRCPVARAELLMRAAGLAAQRRGKCAMSAFGGLEMLSPSLSAFDSIRTRSKADAMGYRSRPCRCAWRPFSSEATMDLDGLDCPRSPIAPRDRRP